MNFIVGIPYVNRPDLLQRAVDSIKPYWPNTVIIDNSEQQELRNHDISSKVEVFIPPVPLTFTQSMNFIIKKLKKIIVMYGCLCIVTQRRSQE